MVRSGNILAGVGPFAIERGLVAADGETKVVIYMENTGQVAEATVQTPKGSVAREGDAQIHGVPGTHAPIPITFRDTAGSGGAFYPQSVRLTPLQGSLVRRLIMVCPV